MSNTNPQVKGLQQPCAAHDLQHKKSDHTKSNVLYLNGKKRVAATVCNTLNVDTDDDMHTVHAEVGLTPSDKPQHIKDIENMTEAALKKAYPKEHNSWRSRRDTAKKESLPWAPEFDEFSGFLRIVGPKPKPKYQLDKTIKEYGYVPDNVRWVSPTQNSLNKDATRFLTHSGETHSVSTWAKKTNTSKSTIFARLTRGWSVSEAITGVKLAASCNSSEIKLKIRIGADELPAVTQLFTEPYMVDFLLHNSLGAWWHTRHPGKLCPVELAYLRTLEDGTPAAGKFEGWPNSLEAFTLLDPCCGSGHFIVAAFLMLVPMRMASEGLSAKDAVDAVLADNLHGLEIDPRCVEIAVFALALAAWRYPDESGNALGDDAQFRRQYWEFRLWTDDWVGFHGSTDEDCEFGGQEALLLWQGGEGRLHKYVAERLGGSTGAWLRGQNAWGRGGVTIRCMKSLPASLYSGAAFDSNVVTITAKNKTDLPAIWAFMSSPEYKRLVRKLNQKLNVGDDTFIQVSYDHTYWQNVALQKYPNGLPKPYSDDPTQWIFHGHPRAATDPLQVGIARLLGYTWPAESDTKMELSEEARACISYCEHLAKDVDDDGIVCLRAVRGEKPAHERLLALLINAWETTQPGSWKTSALDKLLADADCAGKGLDVWLQEKFFEQHAKLFHHRPFIWHVWDGLKDGFSALVNYHKLDTKNLERLNTPLMCSLTNGGNADVSRFLLKAGANPDPDAVSTVSFATAYTPLILAVMNEQTEIVKELINRKVRLDEPDGNGWTALRHATEIGDKKVIKMLTNAGASVDLAVVDDDNLENLKEDDPVPVIFKSIVSGDIKFFESFINSGHDINFSLPTGINLLMTAAASGQESMVVELIDRGADVNQLDSEGHSALWFAFNILQERIIRLLIEAGADVHWVSHDGLTTLHYAAVLGSTDIVNILLKAGVSVDSEDNEGSTPLMYATAQGHLTVGELLIQAGANPDNLNNIDE